MEPGRQFDGYRREVVPLTRLVTPSAVMSEVIRSGRESDTPDEPVLLRARGDGEGYEIADGHHRVAGAVKRGDSHVVADVDDVPDDEPYEPPFHDFTKPLSDHGAVEG